MDEQMFEKALERAKRLLKYRLRSKWELKIRLLEAGFDEAIVEKVIQELEKKGIINDEKFAKLFADHMLNVEGYGPFRIKMKLKELKVDEATVEKAIDEVLRENDVLQIMKRILNLHRVDKSKAREYLFRRGFTPDLLELLDTEVGGADE
ncbi:regulatory protein RecX [Pseudothermotoga thermarum]|uniref:Regulatory protein RecX n=1 Tax=Pseudothermotoga thermarum DSM 5069 TaxID=688269 RepID=F7YWQ1_9THEM|nr:regulatory protein RecX [Pseudothermotoga thermarum]AEH52041.1 regulatory protein RecX [Pseudothermotoga thermarum DSM 5069]